MKYTIYEVVNHTLDEKYLSAARGEASVKKRINHKEILSKVKDCNYSIVIKDIVSSKEKVQEYFSQNTSYQIFRIDKKIPVTDSNGNKLAVYRDDPRFLSGEFQSFHKGRVIVKDQEGNRKCLRKNSAEYLTGKYVGIMKNNLVVKDASGNTKIVNKQDADYLNGTLHHVSKNTLVVKNTNGENLRVSIDDARISSGELLPVNLGKKLVQSLDCDRQEAFDLKCKKLFPSIQGKFISQHQNFLIQDHCEHGDLLIKKSHLKFIYEKSDTKIYCDKCRNIFVNSLVLSDSFISVCRQNFEVYSKNGHLTQYFNESFLQRYFPEIHAAIKTSIGNSWMEKIYCFRNNLKQFPTCSMPNCTSHTEFSKTAKHYNLYCEKHKFNFNTSIAETELFNFISANYTGEINRNDRTILSGKELDIFLPELKLAIEYNGLYTHSDMFKESTYHYDKWKICKDADIDLIQIWEDDWHNKRFLIESFLKNKLNIDQHKVGARQTTIKEVNFNDAKQFLQENHLQGNCPSSIRLGLFYNDELISLMTFGKKRMIMKSKNKENSFELLRFCNKANYSISGGASKLFKHFLDHHSVDSVTSYCALDYFNGNLYSMLGFRNDRHTGVGYWWAKDGVKYHRSNFMKHTLDKSSGISVDDFMKSNKYMKIYNAGNERWIYEKTA